MQSMLTKLIILLIALIGWVVYSKMDQIKEFLGNVEETVPDVVEEVVDDVVAPPKPESTTVYKWQDANGEWHFTSTPPPDGAAESKTYAHDANVVPAVRAKQESSSSSLFSSGDGGSSGSTSGLDALATEEGRNMSNLKRSLQQLKDMDREEDINSTLGGIR